jgi:NAD(P)-dependent dehydrogenase (short-subunit alcohol dehydrogenase family)
VRWLAAFGECIGIAADINDAQQRAGLVERIEAESLQGLAILVNNAGSNWGAPLADYPDAAFLDEMLLLWANVGFRMGDMETAKAKLQQLVFDYPSSALVTEARKKLAGLKEESGEPAETGEAE